MKLRTLAAAAAASLLLLASCGGGGRSVTVGGVSVPNSFYVGELDPSVLASLEPTVSASAKDSVTMTFEFVPDTVAVACYPDDGEPFPVEGTPNGLSFSFPLPDVSGECGFGVEYTIDGVVYSIAFALNIGE